MNENIGSTMVNCLKKRCFVVCMCLMSVSLMPLFAQKTLNSSHQLNDNTSVKVEKKRDVKPVGAAAKILKEGKEAEAARAAEAAAKAEKEAAEAKARALVDKWKSDSVAREAAFVDIELSMFDKAPSFPGGMTAMAQFISENLKYPKECEAEGIEGRVTCQMVVTKEGKLVNVKVVRGLHPLLDAEALRIIDGMPLWEPGRLKGEPVNCRYTMPIFMSYRD